MSHNITAVKPIQSSLTISRDAFIKWIDPENTERLPEHSPIDGMALYHFDQAPGGKLMIPCFHWSMEGSGTSYHDGTLTEFVADLEGSGVFVLVWDEGDSHTGLVISDGKAYRCGVTFIVDTGEGVREEIEKPS